MTTQSIKEKILPILIKQGVTKVALFGSVVRGDMTKKSDVDILIKAPRGMTLFDLGGLKHDLEKKLKREVDILTYGGINPRVKDYILKEEKIIYEKGSRRISRTYSRQH